MRAAVTPTATERVLLLAGLAVLLLLPAAGCNRDKDAPAEFLPLPKSSAALETFQRGLPPPCEDQDHRQTIKRAGEINEEGLKALQKGDLTTAAGDFEAALQLIPSFADARFNLGLVRQREGKHAEALALFDRVMKDVPDWPGAFVNAGLSHAALGHKDIALELMRKAVQLDPGDANSWLNLGLLYAGMNRRDEGIKLLQQAVARLPKDLPLRLALARELINDRRGNEAQTLLNATLDAFPGAAEPLLLLARIAYDTRDLTAARNRLDEADAAGATPGATAYLRGMLAEEQRQYARARKYFKIAVDAQPGNPALLVHYAGMILMEGDYAAALPLLKKARDMQGFKDPQLWLYLGAACKKSGDTAGALDAYTRFLSATDPDNPYFKKDRAEATDAIKALRAGTSFGLPGMPNSGP